jgi:hypothetical protein
MMLWTRLLLDWPCATPLPLVSPLVVRVTQILNDTAMEDTGTAINRRLCSEPAYTDVFGRRWPLAGSIRRRSGER